ncbi:MAG: TRAP transporter small permease [Desulfobacterales bacterium]|nr:MAG: TRAP transporter small permease [Desulfobacterales bacterium]
MKKFFDLLERALRYTLVILLSSMTIVVVIGIFARYILLISIPWTEEIARYLMIWTGFVAFGVAYRKKELISVRLFIDILPTNLFRMALFVSDILCSIFLIVAVIYGIKLCLINMNQLSPASRIPVSIIYAAIPLGCTLYLVFVVESISSFLKLKKG